MLRFTVPYPPSVNALWEPVARGKMVRSRHYNIWAKEAGWEVKIQIRGAHVAGPYAMHMLVTPPDHPRRRDLGNLEKAVSDLLVTLHVVDDDSLLRRFMTEWTGDADPAGKVLITLFECPA